MLRLTGSYKTRTYEYGEYIVEIVSHDGELEAWLRRKDMGVSRYMYGVNDSMGLAGFLSMIEGLIDDEIEYYEEEVEGGYVK